MKGSGQKPPFSENVTAERGKALRSKRVVVASIALAMTLPAVTWGKDTNQGAKIYKTTCIACHGAKGQGVVPGTPDFRNPNGPLAQSDDILFDHIKNGFQSPGSMMAMPPKGGNPSLSDDDIHAVIAYLRETFAGKGKK